MPSTNQNGKQEKSPRRQIGKAATKGERARRANMQAGGNQAANALPAVRPNGARRPVRRNNRPAARRVGKRRNANAASGKAATKAAANAGSNKLSKLLTPENVQESIKGVGNLRKMVKNGLGYLQQADQVLETLYATSNSLKESGVLDKLIKQKGKNLSTEDFTNILTALMSSPIGGQLFKGSKGEGATSAGSE